MTAAPQTGERPEGRWAMRRELAKGLEALEPRQRALLWLAYAEGFEHREIAEMLGLRQNSVRVLLFRARKKLAETLGRLGFSAETAGAER